MSLTQECNNEASGSVPSNTETRIGCPSGCNKFRLRTDDATGYLYNRAGSGGLVMSNIFLASSFIALAQIELGCYGHENECGRIKGFKPSSLISMIGTATGLLSAICLPFVGAIVDCTHYRRSLGIICSIFIVAIQAIQIGTVESTWSIMAVLQAINGFMYQIVSLAATSYIPEISRSLDNPTFHWYCSIFAIVMFAHQILFVMAIGGLSAWYNWDDVTAAQVSQAIDVVVTGFFFSVSWYFYTEKKPTRTLAPDDSIIYTGFRQVFRTSRGIYKHYPKTIGRFFIGAIFTQAGVDAFSSVSITYLTVVMDFDSTQISAFFLSVLLFTIPGTYLASYVARKTDPITALKLQLVTFIIINFAAFYTLTDPSKVAETHFFGMIWGVWFGFYAPLQNMIYAALVPSGQEAELLGLYSYCMQILTWLPPCIFTVLNEIGMPLTWGGMSLNIFLILGLLSFQMMSPWDECVELGKKPNQMLLEEELEGRKDKKWLNKEMEIV